METIGLNNLEQYFTIIYTVSFLSRMLHCILSNEQKPAPSLVLQFCCFPLKLWLMSQMYKKLWWLVDCIFKNSCKNGSNLPSDFVLSKTPL